MDKDVIPKNIVGNSIFLKEDSMNGGDGSEKTSSLKSSSSSTKSSFEDDEFLQLQNTCDNGQTKTVDYTFNIIMLGDSGVGKSDLIGRLCDDNFTTKFVTTIGVSVESYTLEIDEKKAKLQIWDPSGSRRFRDLISKYFHNAHGIIFVYDLNYKKSFESIKDWMTSLSNNPAVGSKVAKILIGNKCDIMNRREVEPLDGESFALAQGIKFFETSSRTGINVRQAFTTLCQEMKANHINNIENHSVPNSKTGSPD